MEAKVLYGPDSDLNRDYFVDNLNVDILADQWLTIPDPCDFAIIGENYGL